MRYSNTKLRNAIGRRMGRESAGIVAIVVQIEIGCYLHETVKIWDKRIGHNYSYRHYI